MTKSYQTCGFFETLLEAKKTFWTPFQASAGLGGRHGFGTRMGPLGQRNPRKSRVYISVTSFLQVYEPNN